jgi:hypothetical protein
VTEPQIVTERDLERLAAHEKELLEIELRVMDLIDELRRATPTPRTTLTLPSLEEVAAVVDGLSSAFTGAERLHHKLHRIRSDWERPSTPFGRRAPAADPSLADVGALWSCTVDIHQHIESMQSLVAELERDLRELDLTRLDLIAAESRAASSRAVVADSEGSSHEEARGEDDGDA